MTAVIIIIVVILIMTAIVVPVVVIIVIVTMAWPSLIPEDLIDFAIGQRHYVQVSVRSRLNIGADAKVGSEEE